MGIRGIGGIGEYWNRSIRKISELCKINTLKLQSLLKSCLSLTQYTLFPFYLIPPIPYTLPPYPLYPLPPYPLYPYTPISLIPFTPISLIPLYPLFPHTPSFSNK